MSRKILLTTLYVVIVACTNLYCTSNNQTKSELAEQLSDEQIEDTGPAVPDAAIEDDTKTSSVTTTDTNTDRQKLYVRCEVLRIRQGPSTKYPTVGYLTFNQHVISKGIESGWVKIDDGKYVSMPYLSHHSNKTPHIP